MTVGERVKILAEKQGISLRELAKQANLSYNTVYSIARRGSERVAPDTISRLANALGVNANELTADASIRVNSAPEMVELQQKVAAGQATEQEKQAWMEANLRGLRRMQNSVKHMLSELEQCDGTKEIARQSKLLRMFEQLTDDGQEKALDFLEIMLGNPKYKK